MADTATSFHGVARCPHDGLKEGSLQLVPTTMGFYPFLRTGGIRNADGNYICYIEGPVVRFFIIATRNGEYLWKVRSLRAGDRPVEPETVSDGPPDRFSAPPASAENWFLFLVRTRRFKLAWYDID